MWMAVGHYNPVWHRLMPLRLADCFLLKSPFAPIWSWGSKNMGTGGYKIQIGDDLQYEYTTCFQTHTQRVWKLRLMIDPTATTYFCSILVSIFSFLYPLWAGKRTVTLALLRAGQQAEWLGVNHSFVSLSWHIKSGRRAAARTARVRDGRTTR